MVNTILKIIKDYLFVLKIIITFIKFFFNHKYNVFVRVGICFENDDETNKKGGWGEISSNIYEKVKIVKKGEGITVRDISRLIFINSSHCKRQ